MKGRAAEKGPRERGRNKRKEWIRLGKKELHKNVDLVSGYEIPAPSRTSVGMTFLEDGGLALSIYFYYLFRVVPLL